MGGSWAQWSVPRGQSETNQLMLSIKAHAFQKFTPHTHEYIYIFFLMGANMITCQIVWLNNAILWLICILYLTYFKTYWSRLLPWLTWWGRRPLLTSRHWNIQIGNVQNRKNTIYDRQLCVQVWHVQIWKEKNKYVWCINNCIIVLYVPHLILSVREMDCLGKETVCLNY